MSYFKPYRSYNFKDKDPIIDQIHTLIDDSGLSIYDVSALSGVSYSAIYNWLYGDTMRPNHASTAAVIGGMGFEYTIVRKHSAKVIQLDLEKAKRQLAIARKAKLKKAA
jgi:hypothetical protein